MYDCYPCLIRELTLRLSQKLSTDPHRSQELYQFVLHELESDQKLLENIFGELQRRSRLNNELFSERLKNAFENHDTEAIRRSFYHWEIAGAGLRELLQLAFNLSHRDFFPFLENDLQELDQLPINSRTNTSSS